MTQRHKVPITPITEEARAILRGQAAEPIEKPEAAESDLPAFPEIAWRGLFREYRDAMNGTTEACDGAHFATLWAAVAAILGRDVEMHAGDVIYPNVYLAVFGETGDKKTTAERRISACNLFEHWPHVRLVRGVGSTEGLADAVQDAETGLSLPVGGIRHVPVSCPMDRLDVAGVHHRML